MSKASNKRLADQRRAFMEAIQEDPDDDAHRLVDASAEGAVAGGAVDLDALHGPVAHAGAMHPVLEEIVPRTARVGFQLALMKKVLEDNHVLHLTDGLAFTRPPAGE